VNGFRFQTRVALNGTTAKSFAGTAAPPGWVRLTRAGANVTGSWSTDGVTFTAVGAPVAVGLGTKILVGLAVTSHKDLTLATAVFDNVIVTATSAPAVPTGLTATPGSS